MSATKLLQHFKMDERNVGGINRSVPVLSNVESPPKIAVKNVFNVEQGNAKVSRGRKHLSSTFETKSISEQMTVEKLENLNKEYMFSPVTEDIKKNIYLKCQEALIGKEMHLKTCAVCDSLRKDVDCISESSRNFYNRCRNRFAPDSGMHSGLINAYHVSACIPELENVLLSRRGLKIAENGEIELWVCNLCYNSLNSGEDIDEKIHRNFQ